MIGWFRRRQKVNIDALVRAIARRGPSTPGWLAHDLGVFEEPTMVDRLRKAECLGLVTPTPTINGNAVYSLTDAGRRLSELAS